MVHPWSSIPVNQINSFGWRLPDATSSTKYMWVKLVSSIDFQNPQFAEFLTRITVYIRNSAIIRNSDWSIFVKKTSTNTVLTTNNPNFIKIPPLDSPWWGDSNEYNYIKIGSLVAEIFVFKVSLSLNLTLTKNHVIYI